MQVDCISRVKTCNLYQSFANVSKPLEYSDQQFNLGAFVLSRWKGDLSDIPAMPRPFLMRCSFVVSSMGNAGERTFQWLQSAGDIKYNFGEKSNQKHMTAPGFLSLLQKYYLI